MPSTRAPLSEALILAWADAYRARTGAWPKILTADKRGLPAGDTWQTIDLALRKGYGGLPGGDSLPRLLARRRGARNLHGLPRLTLSGIVRWAQDHHARTGQWPTRETGPVHAAPGEVWVNIDTALRQGIRGLKGGDNLRKLLARRLGVYTGAVPRLTEAMILSWADAHYAATGEWPRAASGPVVTAQGENWRAIQAALNLGLRGLPGRDTLARLLVRHGRQPKLWQHRPRQAARRQLTDAG
jgi:hypothetical protein